MLLYKKSEAVYSFQCPVRSHWKHRSKTFCDSDENYLCLYNQNENNFTEFCKEDTEFEGPGKYKYTFSCSNSVNVTVLYSIET